jgi:hypothetical protein
MLKRLSALLLCASQVFLLPLINQPAIAWLRSGVGPTMSDPIDLDFDKAITKMHTLRPVDKPACAYVSELVLKDIKDQFYMGVDPWQRQENENCVSIAGMRLKKVGPQIACMNDKTQYVPTGGPSETNIQH